ncbi:MAG: GLPGLI family protein, partial [Flavobacteriales bacterium]|nr:GLPGLI family protein [Flavobacteriales bacterium]
MKNLIIVFLLISVALSAQTHRFIYEYKFKSDSLAKDFRKENMVLDVNPDEVKFYPYVYAENDSLNKVRDFKNIMWDDAVPALKRKSGSNTNISYFLLTDFFSLKTEDKILWTLTNETKKSGDYLLQKATAGFGGRKWIAWFSKDVAVDEGPYKFRGLPGLIFEINDDRNNFIFNLIKSQKFN